MKLGKGGRLVDLVVDLFWFLLLVDQIADHRQMYSARVDEPCTGPEQTSLYEYAIICQSFWYGSQGSRAMPDSQCQAIHARSIFPCQDTPDVKSTYEFVVDSQMPVIASGLLRSTEKLDNELRRHTYFQEIPIPSYLVAIASG